MIYKIKDIFGKEICVQPVVKLYNVKNFLGKKTLGLNISLNELDENGEFIGQYCTLTLSFGEFIGMKNAVYIDTNNCPFAEQFLTDNNIATPTGLTKLSGFCRYPLWLLNEDFLIQHGKDAYGKYVDAYNAEMEF